MHERLWVRKLLTDFGIGHTAIDIRADNQGTIALAKDFKPSAPTKHIATAYHLTRDYVAEKLVRMEYIPSALIAANGLPKALGRNKHWENYAMLGMVEINADDGSCGEGVLDQRNIR